MFLCADAVMVAGTHVKFATKTAKAMVSLVGTAGVLLGVTQYYGLSLEQSILVLDTIGVVALGLLFSGVFADLTTESTTDSSPQSPQTDGGVTTENEQSEEVEVRTVTGGGAIGGIVAGAAVGSLIGPAGTVAGTLIGGWLGNEIEAEFMGHDEQQ